MWREVTLGVAEVRAVEPHVALVEEPVEHQPGALVDRWRAQFERPSVQQRPIVVGECGRRPPVTGHVDRRPSGVVERGVGEAASQTLVSRSSPPWSRQLHQAAATWPSRLAITVYPVGTGVTVRL